MNTNTNTGADMNNATDITGAPSTSWLAQILFGRIQEEGRIIADTAARWSTVATARAQLPPSLPQSQGWPDPNDLVARTEALSAIASESAAAKTRRALAWSVARDLGVASQIKALFVASWT